MAIDFDLSNFRLVKSFAAVEISRNVGVFSEDLASEPDRQPARKSDASNAATAARSGVSASTTANSTQADAGQIPDRIDDTMRNALDERLEGPERQAVSWQHGQRNAALSLGGLARPGATAETRRNLADENSQVSAQGPDTLDNGARSAAILAPNVTAQAVLGNLTPEELLATDYRPGEATGEPGAPEPRPHQGSAGSSIAAGSGAGLLPVRSILPQVDAAMGEENALSTADDPSVIRQPGRQPTGRDGTQPATASRSASLETSSSVRMDVGANDGTDRAGQRPVEQKAGAGQNPTPIRTDVPIAGASIDTTQVLPAATSALFGEVQMADVLQTMVDGRQQNKPVPAAKTPVAIDGGQGPSEQTDESAPRDVATRDLRPLTRAFIAEPGLMGEQAEVTDRRSGDDARLMHQRTANDRLTAPTGARSNQPGTVEALSATLPEAVVSEISQGRGSQASAVDGPAETGSAAAVRLSDLESSAERDTNAPPQAKAPAVMPSVKVLEILDALAALSATAGEGSEDWQSLSGVIFNAAMIPGWPPPRPLENPASARQADLLMQAAQSQEAEEAPMTPEQLLAYLVSIGANLRLLRALQELVNRVEKKNGPALLAWLAGLVSALKVIEKSLKDIVRDGMELPDWLAELADASKKNKRRKLFHI